MIRISQTKIDVTERVFGKMEHNQMNLYLDQQQIGYVKNGNEVVLREGFQYDADHFYQLFQTDTDSVDQYVNNCDQGWC